MKGQIKIWNKTTRTILIIGLSFLIATGGYVWNKSINQSRVTTVSVLVAKEDIPPYTELTKENTQLKAVVESEVPDDAVAQFSELKAGDAFASSYGFQKAAVIRSSYITTAAQSKLGTSVALKEGYSEVGVKVDLVTSAGSQIKAGSVVDAIASIKSNNGQAQTVANPQLTKLKVLALKNSEGRDLDPTANTSLVPAVAVLEVTDAQRSFLISYQESGSVYLSPSGDQSNKNN